MARRTFKIEHDFEATGLAEETRYFDAGFLFGQRGRVDGYMVRRGVTDVASGTVTAIISDQGTAIDAGTPDERVVAKSDSTTMTASATVAGISSDLGAVGRRFTNGLRLGVMTTGDAGAMALRFVAWGHVD